MDGKRADGLPCGLAVVAADGRVQHASAGLGRLLGKPVAGLRGRPFDSLLTPAAAVLYQSYLLPLLHLHGQVEEFELSLRGPAGERLSALFYGTRHAAGAPEEGSIDIVLVPVRERRRLEDELLRIKRAADLAPGMMFQLVREADGRLFFPYVSESVRALYATSAEAAATDAQAVLRWVHPEDAARLRERLTAEEQSGPWTELLRVLAPGSAPAWHEMQASPQFRHDGRRVWHGFIANVTQREQLAAERAAREAEQAQARSRSEFLARISHEFRTPLNAIIGFSQLLTRPGGPELSAQQKQQLQTIGSAGTSLLHLVNDVLDITAMDGRADALQLVPLPIDAALQQVLALVEPQAAAAQVRLPSPEVEAGLVAMADAQRLGQVLANLLSNAVKYNRPGGEIRVRVHADAGEVVLAVADTGCGLDAKQRAQLFQPFNRLGAERSAVPGTGLGLVITRNLVVAMGGRLRVDSEPGVGSCFEVRLPQAPENAGTGIGAQAAEAAWLRQPPHSAGEPAADGGAGTVAGASALADRGRGTCSGAGREGDDGAKRAARGAADHGAPHLLARAALSPGRFRVLYVEDNEVNAVLMQAILALRPAVRLQIARDGAAALAVATREPPQLLLVDLHLPDMDGVALVHRLRALPGMARVPAVLVSASVGEQQQAAAREAGMLACWSKPLDVEQTLTAMDRLLQARPLG
jgi:signal transduction histidine kinase/ActR/RegA family two-component response regulator